MSRRSSNDNLQDGPRGTKDSRGSVEDKMLRPDNAEYRRPEGERENRSGQGRSPQPRRLDDAMRSTRNSRSGSPEPPQDKRSQRPNQREYTNESSQPLNNSSRIETRQRPPETQWSRLEEEEIRRREAQERARSRVNPYDDGRRRADSRQQDSYTDDYLPEDDLEPRRRRGGCLGHLLWFLFFAILGYASIWFLIHGVSRWI